MVAVMTLVFLPVLVVVICGVCTVIERYSK
uniref:Uncharacterized protein n=1 Tax=virus sp. ctd0M1 TaxID=2827993 RepID=A0A8S5RDH6_9VIRU|nr:MAG TPA: hypothetical protein [virus sp. ctd0M1]